MWQGVWSLWIPVAVEVSNNVAGCLISLDSGSSRGVYQWGRVSNLIGFR